MFLIFEALWGRDIEDTHQEIRVLLLLDPRGKTNIFHDCLIKVNCI